MASISLTGAAPAPAAGAPSMGVLVLGVVALAALLRWIGFSGFFGSDEVTYIASALKPLDGDWTLDDYVGANRIGVNLPMAACAAVFGRTEFGLSLYGVLCSLGEVAVVTWLGGWLFGRRAGLFAGLLMATLPTHVNIAGRMIADPALSLAITGSFALFALAERRRWALGFFLAGGLAGLSFLVKPVTLFVFGILLLYPLLERRIDMRWGWMAAGFVAAMALNGWLYRLLTGRFWYVFEVVRERRQSGYLEAGAAEGSIQGEPFMYVAYLLLRIWHTGLLGWLALGACVAMARARRPAAEPAPGRRYVVFWALGLVAILSFLPVSFSPLMLVPKQTNYMLIFVAPLCLLAGWLLAWLPGRWGTPLLVLSLLAGTALALLLQAVLVTFTANSWATLAFVQRQPEGRTVHVMSNAYRAAHYRALLGGADLRPRLGHADASIRTAEAAERLVVIDTQTLHWDRTRPVRSLSEVPACWRRVQSLSAQPAAPGIAVARVLEALLRAVPGAAAVADRLQRQAVTPQPAVVFAIPPGC